MSTHDPDKKYLNRGVAFVNLSSYLQELKAIENALPEDQRLEVPTMKDIAIAIGSNKLAISRLSRGESASINIALAGRIVNEMRSRGFPMEIANLISYIGPAARPRELILEKRLGKHES